MGEPPADGRLGEEGGERQKEERIVTYGVCGGWGFGEDNN